MILLKIFTDIQSGEVLNMNNHIDIKFYFIIMILSLTSIILTPNIYYLLLIIVNNLIFVLLYNIKLNIKENKNMILIFLLVIPISILIGISILGILKIFLFELYMLIFLTSFEVIDYHYLLSYLLSFLNYIGFSSSQTSWFLIHKIVIVNRYIKNYFKERKIYFKERFKSNINYDKINMEIVIFQYIKRKFTREQEKLQLEIKLKLFQDRKTKCSFLSMFSNRRNIMLLFLYIILLIGGIVL